MSAKPRHGRMPPTEPWQDMLILQFYSGCLDTEDRHELNERLAWGNDPKLMNLYNAASALGVTCGRPGVKAPLPERENPRETQFTAQDDNYIVKAFDMCSVEQIARQRGHSMGAIYYRARHLGCRKPAAYWTEAQVAEGLQIRIQDVLARKQLEKWQLEDGHWLLGAASLARWIDQDWDKLLEAGADEFFLLEIVESYLAVLSLADEWGRCKYLSSEHVCLNPRAGLQYNHCCAGLDRPGGYEAGESPNCGERNRPFPAQIDPKRRLMQLGNS